MTPWTVACQAPLSMEILQARILEWAALPSSRFSSVQSLSHVQLFVIPRTIACQAPLFVGILQARILEWVAMPSSRESSQPRDQTQVSLNSFLVDHKLVEY